MTEANTWGGGLTRAQAAAPSSEVEANAWGGRLTRAQLNALGVSSEENTWGGRLTLRQNLAPATISEANSWGGGLTARQLAAAGPASEEDSWGGFITRRQLVETGGDLRLTILAGASPATRNYISRVESDDGQPLENGVLAAMVTFANWRIPLGGACCILAGARTLAGALEPMVGAAPTGLNLASSDYNRRRILLNGSNKTIRTNETLAAYGQNNRHVFIRYPSPYVTPAAASFVWGGNNISGSDALLSISTTSWRLRSASGVPVSYNSQPTTIPVGRFGVFRNVAGSVGILFGSNALVSAEPNTSATVVDSTLHIGGDLAGAQASPIGPSIYSLGPHIDPATLDTNSAALMSLIYGVVP